jgi:chromosome partitioning protein
MVAVFNQKGGVAKTTTACNLAVCLAAFGYRVLLVDLDAQGNASQSFGIAPLPPVGAFEVIVGRAKPQSAIIETSYPGLSVLPATLSLRDEEQMLVHAGRHPGLLEGRLAATGVDLVVVDCPPALAAATATALASASAVLMPVRPDPFAHDGLVNTWYEIKRIREAVNANLGVAGILLTMTDLSQTSADMAMVIRSEFGQQVYPVEIGSDPMVVQATRQSLPVCVLDPDGLAGRAYMEATAEVLARLARQNRGQSRLAAPAETTEALNTLRDWRATIHHALLRNPATALAWASEEDEPYSDPSAQPAPTPNQPKPPSRLAWLAAGLVAGMVLEAVLGLVGHLF